MKYSAGIWAFKKTLRGIEVLLVHPGGPFYIKKDEGVWSVPKGEYNPALENDLEVAKREFTEETGNTIAAENFISLNAVKTKGGKILKTWAVETDFKQAFITSNYFEMEWPPKSGKLKQFPETDKAEWFTIEEAKTKLNGSQIPNLVELDMLLKDYFKD